MAERLAAKAMLLYGIWRDHRAARGAPLGLAITLEAGDRHRMWISRAGIPEQIKAGGNAVRNRIDLLFLGAVEIATEKHVIEAQILLALPEIRIFVAADGPAEREMDGPSPSRVSTVLGKALAAIKSRL